MTRDEAKEKLLGECKIIFTYSWSEDRQKMDVQQKHLSDYKTLKLLNEVFNYFEDQLKQNKQDYDKLWEMYSELNKQKICDGCKK